jgi:hypothetical protein
VATSPTTSLGFPTCQEELMFLQLSTSLRAEKSAIDLSFLSFLRRTDSYSRAEFTIIYCAGTGEDMGQIQNWVQILSSTLKVNLPQKKDLIASMKGVFFFFFFLLFFDFLLGSAT